MRWLVVSMIAAASLSQVAFAQTTSVYEYDPLGRLVKATAGSAPATRYTYDATDNRTKVTNNPNLPPTAVADSFFRVGGVNNNPVSGNWQVLNNDTDPNLPSDTLTIINVTPGAGAPTVSIAPGGTAVAYTETAGYYEFSYMIQDSQGATSSVTSNFEISCRVGAPC